MMFRARCCWWLSFSWLFLILLYTSRVVHASASIYYSHQWQHPHSPSRRTFTSSSSDANRSHPSSSRRSNLFPGASQYRSSKDASLTPPTAVLLTAARSKKERTKKQSQKQQQAVATTAEPDVLKKPQEISFEELGPVGKVVAATTELGVAIVYNYCQGYLTGWLAGTFIGIPGLMFRPLEKGPGGAASAVPPMFMNELKGRLGRMNTRSVRFGKNFGGISAIFKGSDVAVRRVRYGKNDEWNDILGSAVAGAVFARKEGPLGMAKGAILWGGMIYLLNGAGGGSSPLSRGYTEEPVEF